MKTPIEVLRRKHEEGAVGYMILWVLGVPAIILVIVFLLRGCT